MKKFIILCISVWLTACSNNNTNPTAATPAIPPTVKSVAFSSTAAPTDLYAAGDPYAAYHMSVPYTTSQATVTFSDNTTSTYPLEHQSLFKSDDVIPTGAHAGEYYGGIIDANGAPVLDPYAMNNPHYLAVTTKAVAAGLLVANKDQFVADTPDGSALIQIAGSPSSATTADLSYLTHFEYVTWDGNRASQYGKNPMFIGNSVLSQDLTTGMLTMKRFDKMAFSAEKGLWIPCAASKSPWNTFIGSEEYEPDQWNWDMNAANAAVPLSFSNANLVAAFKNKFKATAPRPYDYGYVTETTVDQAGVAATKKHYATGRWARELIKMMPDERTYYSGDDGSSTSLFMGVADTSGDLSAVTLYAAKVTQTSPINDPYGAVTLSWVKMGHATDATIKGMVTGGITFNQIFDAYAEVTPGMAPAVIMAPASGYKRVFNYYHPASKGKAEWLRLKPGMAQAAAFLETHRYAAYIGATSEFTKMEGVALNEADKKAYIAISYQYKSMTLAGDIQFGHMDAGATYELSMAANQLDSVGGAINSAWVGTSLAAVPELVGSDNLPYVAGKGTPDAQGNRCAVARVANPDNLKYSAASRTLFIGEDSNCHVNNFIWAFNIDTRKLSRILSNPMGAEATGLMAVDNINGFSYIGANYQHPGDGGVGAPPAALIAAVEAANPNFAQERNRAGGVGYIHYKGMPKQ